MEESVSKAAKTSATSRPQRRARTVPRKPPPRDDASGTEEARLEIVREDGPDGQALRLLNLGLGNFVIASRVVAIVSQPQSAPVKRLRDEAGEQGRLVDTTQGRRTRSLLVTDSNHVILCAVNPETMAVRLGPGSDSESHSKL
jgi:regulator of extracellular matrix RemA (YlzA/DUF370 family)